MLLTSLVFILSAHANNETITFCDMPDQRFNLTGKAEFDHAAAELIKCKNDYPKSIAFVFHEINSKKNDYTVICRDVTDLKSYKPDDKISQKLIAKNNATVYNFTDKYLLASKSKAEDLSTKAKACNDKKPTAAAILGTKNCNQYACCQHFQNNSKGGLMNLETLNYLYFDQIGPCPDIVIKAKSIKGIKQDSRSSIYDKPGIKPVGDGEKPRLPIAPKQTQKTGEAN